MRFQIERARSLFEASDEGIARLPREAQIPVLLARILYAQILDRVEL
ncbi:squalene/phytoene synthase family protein, partial [Vibrio parahaemolyticus]